MKIETKDQVPLSTSRYESTETSSLQQTLNSPIHKIKGQSSRPSPALKKKLEQQDIEARAQRLTPELPAFDTLSVTYHDECSNEQSESGESSSIPDIYEPALIRSPSLRRLRVRTLEAGQQHAVDLASTERMKRNTDSMLEDAVIAQKLKRRLGSRRNVGHSRQIITNTSLSEFIRKSILEGSLDAVSAARPTNENLCRAADLAMKVCLEGYFDNIDDSEMKKKARRIFLESLIREEYNQGEYICRQNENGDKLFIIEEGMVQFITGDQIAGLAQNGSIFGELSLVYGIPRTANVKVLTPCAIVWSMDTISFRRIQALLANESLKNRQAVSTRSEKVQYFQKRYSSLSDLQEPLLQGLACSLDFKSLKKVALIGKGTFGSVFLVSLKEKDRKKEKYFALKCMSKASIVERSNQKRVLIEKNILQDMKSPFIVSLFGTYQDSSSIYFLTDFVQGGNLMSYMINKDILNHTESLFFCANMVAALVYMHKKGFIHRDVKPENCLIEKDGYLKLCDFGMAKRLPTTVHLQNGRTEVVTLAFTMCGTPEFMAPEFVLSTGYDRGVDWWAVGSILVEMLTGRSPFEFDGDLKKTFKEVCFIGMGRKRFTSPDVFKKRGMEEADKFVQSLLTASRNRLGKDDSVEVQKHDYFTSIDFDDLKERRITAPYIPKISHASDISYFKKDTDRLSEEVVQPFTGDDTWCKDCF